jgi:hypothetical protein
VELTGDSTAEARDNHIAGRYKAREGETPGRSTRSRYTAFMPNKMSENIYLGLNNDGFQ